MTGKKKSAALVGSVLRHVKDPALLKSWAEFMAGIEPWKRLERTAEQLLAAWSRPDRALQFYCAIEPRDAKRAPEAAAELTFELEQGLVIFSTIGGRATAEAALKSSLAPDLGDGGWIEAIATKFRHKSVGKYLLSAAERVISERHGRVFAFVAEWDQPGQRFFKAQGYEQIGRAEDRLKPGNPELLLTKQLTS